MRMINMTTAIEAAKRMNAIVTLVDPSSVARATTQWGSPVVELKVSHWSMTVRLMAVLELAGLSWGFEAGRSVQWDPKTFLP